MPYFEGDDIKMFYEDIGIGQPIIFLHGGFSRGIIAFASQMFFFQATAEFRCILPDMRGFGRTVSKSTEWTTPQLADDVIAFMDGLNIPKAHLVGHSLGGDVALYCAAKYTDRCITVTSIGSTGAVNDAVKKYKNTFDPEALKKAGKTNIIEMLKKNHYDASGGDWERFIKQVLLNTERYPNFSDEDLRKITIPFLLIAGDEDELIQVEEIDRLKENIKNIQIEIMDRCGHSPHILMEKPMKVNEIIYRFLKKAKA